MRQCARFRGTIKQLNDRFRVADGYVQTDLLDWHPQEMKSPAGFDRAVVDENGGSDDTLGDNYDAAACGRL